MRGGLWRLPVDAGIMSTWWGYRCRTCSQESERWANGSTYGGEAGLVTLLAMRQELELLTALSDGALDTGSLSHYAGEALAWLDEHKGHDVAVVESCGRVVDPVHALR